MSIIDGLQSQYQPFKSYVPKDIDDIKKRVVNEVEEYFANLLNDYENVSIFLSFIPSNRHNRRTMV